MEKIFFSTLGCAKNLVDSEMMAGVLKKEGYEIIESVDNADIAIINTCGFIESAKQESINEILTISKYKEEGRLKKLVVTGCLAQRYSEELMKEIPEINILMGTTSFQQIVDKLKLKDSKSKLFIDDINREILDLPRYIMTQRHSAYLKIAEGCDNLCTYCIIPKLRGKYRSRDIDSIISEAKKLADSGIKELIIIAQDTSKYGLDLYGEKSLHILLDKLEKIDGFVWIRLLYLYPEDVDMNLLKVIENSKKILPYFDIPIQHSSDRILKLMNRKTTSNELNEKINMIRNVLPNATIRTTLIVGFPGETEEDFDILKKFVEDIKFDRLGVFEYSKEENTPASKMPNQIDDNIKTQRKNVIMELQQKISYLKNKSKIGEIFDVLIENKEDTNIYTGRTYQDMIEIDGLVFINTNKELKIGEFVKVTITDALEYDLIGEVYESSK